MVDIRTHNAASCHSCTFPLQRFFILKFQCQSHTGPKKFMNTQSFLFCPFRRKKKEKEKVFKVKKKKKETGTRTLPLSTQEKKGKHTWRHYHPPPSSSLTQIPYFHHHHPHALVLHSNSTRRPTIPSPSLEPLPLTTPPTKLTRPKQNPQAPTQTASTTASPRSDFATKAEPERKLSSVKPGRAKREPQAQAPAPEYTSRRCP